MSRTEELSTKFRTLTYDHERLLTMHRTANEKLANAEREVNLHKTKLTYAYIPLSIISPTLIILPAQHNVNSNPPNMHTNKPHPNSNAHAQLSKASAQPTTKNSRGKRENSIA
jgi:hypothetical protein